MSERVEVVLQRVSDGEQRTIVDEDCGSVEATEYYWTEGNASCDCNRHLEFERAGGVEPDDHMECGDEVAYRLLSLKIGGCEYVDRRGNATGWKVQNAFPIPVDGAEMVKHWMERGIADE